MQKRPLNILDYCPVHRRIHGGPDGENDGYATLAQCSYLLFAVAGTINALNGVFEDRQLARLAADAPDTSYYDAEVKALYVDPSLYYRYFEHLSPIRTGAAAAARREMAYLLRKKIEGLGGYSYEWAEQENCQPPDVTLLYLWVCHACGETFNPAGENAPGSLAAWRYEGKSYGHNCGEAQAGHFSAYSVGFAPVKVVRLITEAKLESVSFFPPIEPLPPCAPSRFTEVSRTATEIQIGDALSESVDMLMRAARSLTQVKDIRLPGDYIKFAESAEGLETAKPHYLRDALTNESLDVYRRRLEAASIRAEFSIQETRPVTDSYGRSVMSVVADGIIERANDDGTD